MSELAADESDRVILSPGVGCAGGEASFCFSSAFLKKQREREKAERQYRYKRED